MQPDTTVQCDLLLGLSDPLPVARRASGYIRVPHSSNTSAYGFVPIPFAIVGPAEGVHVLIMAGSHGDEAEGQVAVSRLLAELDPAQMRGRLIALPMANGPAARAGLRNSTLDGLNLNRVYPGDMLGPPTAVIADYVERRLMTECDVVLDLHTSSASFDYLSCATVIYHPEREERIRRLSLAVAFGAPLILLMYSYQDRNSSGAAKRAGAVRIATELSGPDTVEMAMAGMTRLLRWTGVLPTSARAKGEPPELLVVHPEPHYVYGLCEGVFEPRVRLGEQVRAGALIGAVHDPSRPFAPPHEVRSVAEGRVVCLRGFGLTARGDCLLHLAGPAGDDLAEELQEAASANWLRARRRRRASGRRSLSAAPDADAETQ